MSDSMASLAKQLGNIHGGEAEIAALKSTGGV